MMPPGLPGRWLVVARLVFTVSIFTSRILAAYGNRLREEVDLKALSDDLLEVVGETVQPVHASLWLRPSDGAPPAGGRKA